jgi:ribosome maturation factor RimP
MSKIQAELAEATEVTLKRGGDRQEFLIALLKAIAKLSDKEWEKLSQEAQDWFNEAADAQNAKAKTIPDFPDLEKEETKEEKTTGRRGATVDKVEESVMKVGQQVKLTTKRGKVIEGKVVELDKEVVVVKTADGEEELALDRIESKEIFHGDAGGADDGPADPIKVGVTVTLITKRGKEYVGKIVELDGDLVVLDVDGKDEEFDRGRVESITPVKAKGKDEEKTTGRRGASKDKVDDADADKKRSSNPAGVSIGTRIKELIADDMDATEADLAKILKKEGIEFRENTLKLNYSDCHKFLDVLKAKKLIK